MWPTDYQHHHSSGQLLESSSDQLLLFFYFLYATAKTCRILFLQHLSKQSAPYCSYPRFSPHEFLSDHSEDLLMGIFASTPFFSFYSLNCHHSVFSKIDITILFQKPLCSPFRTPQCIIPHSLALKAFQNCHFKVNNWCPHGYFAT